MNSLLKRQRQPEPAPAELVEDWRLLIPWPEIRDGIEAMVRTGKLSESGHGWTLKDFGDWVRIDLDRETLGLPRG